MTPSAIREEAEKAGLSEEILETLPTCSVAGEEVSTGNEAKCFAQYMRIHALEATGGKTYSEMGRYLTADGKDTNDADAAANDPKTGRPVENAARNLWVTETALSTALNVAFFAEQVSMFGLVVAIALIFAGLGFGILAFCGVPLAAVAPSVARPAAVPYFAAPGLWPRRGWRIDHAAVRCSHQRSTRRQRK